MKINKFTRLKDGRIKLKLEDKKELVVYEDILFKYDLLITKELSDDILKEIDNDNYEVGAYDQALKYLKIRLRSISEVKIYLSKKGYSDDLINDVVNKLILEGYLNDKNFVKAYIIDKINFTNNGPLKIINDLENMNVDNDIIFKEIGVFTKDLVRDRIQKYITKSLKSNHNKSIYVLKSKILFNLINLGYEKEDISLLLESTEEEDSKEIYQKEYQKIYQKLSKKYSGRELEYKVRQKMYQKGFMDK